MPVLRVIKLHCVIVSGTEASGSVDHLNQFAINVLWSEMRRNKQVPFTKHTLLLWATSAYDTHRGRYLIHTFLKQDIIYKAASMLRHQIKPLC